MIYERRAAWSIDQKTNNHNKQVHTHIMSHNIHTKKHTLLSDNIFQTQKPSAFAWTTVGFEVKHKMILASNTPLKRISKLMHFLPDWKISNLSSVATCQSTKKEGWFKYVHKNAKQEINKNGHTFAPRTKTILRIHIKVFFSCTRTLT